ncbi:SpaN/EivJ family type III secretion system needle length determinant [Yersinia mollaretii]|uniref:SpaN/EivJ family type III secretion system needle length determinant n=1 Tax=Yersinia mollaretii TaxID=33060 RepID=UPI0011A0F8A6|nr:type III secretion protein [Yersinia mollaretii]MDN0112194.1 type III secretion protein [Yersinia mollaretii]
MVAIKQAPTSTSLDLKGDDSARISPSAIRRDDNEQRVSSVRGEAQKKAAELLNKLLLDKTKQRKKQGEEQLAPALLVPTMLINSLPQSAPVKLHFAQPLVSEQAPAGEVLAPISEAAAERPQAVEVAPTKSISLEKNITLAKLGGENVPTPVVDKKSSVVVADTFTRPNVIPQESGDQPLVGLSPVAGENPVMLNTSVPTFSAEGDKAAMAHTPLPTPAPDMPRVVTRDALFNTAESGRESASSAPFADKKESAQGDERPQGVVTQPSTTPAATLSDAVEIKAPPQTLPEGMAAEGMMAKGEPMTEHRTLSYTFTQWKNSPMVTFELSGAGELTAMTASAEVQQALQENHYLLESENPLHFRDDEQDKERRGRQQSEQEDEA